MARRSDGEGTAPKQRKDGIWYRDIRIEGTDKRKYLYAKSKAELNKKHKGFTKQASVFIIKAVKLHDIRWGDIRRTPALYAFFRLLRPSCLSTWEGISQRRKAA